MNEQASKEPFIDDVAEYIKNMLTVLNTITMEYEEVAHLKRKPDKILLKEQNEELESDEELMFSGPDYTKSIDYTFTKNFLSSIQERLEFVYTSVLTLESFTCI